MKWIVVQLSGTPLDPPTKQATTITIGDRVQVPR